MHAKQRNEAIRHVVAYVFTIAMVFLAVTQMCIRDRWKTGLRNDGFQYAFVSLGNKIGMAIGTALLAALLGKYGYVANQEMCIRDSSRPHYPPAGYYPVPDPYPEFPNRFSQKLPYFPSIIQE